MAKQMSAIKTFDAWHQTKQGLFVFALIELAIAYGFASWAIDSGSLWLYLLTIIFLVGGLHNAIKFLGKIVLR